LATLFAKQLEQRCKLWFFVSIVRWYQSRSQHNTAGGAKKIQVGPNIYYCF